MGTIILLGVAVVAGAVALYLVLRNNPNAKAKLDTVTDQVETKIKK